MWCLSTCTCFHAPAFPHKQTALSTKEQQEVWFPTHSEHQTGGYLLLKSPVTWMIQFGLGFNDLTLQLTDISQCGPPPALPGPHPASTHLIGSWSSLSSLLCAILMPLFFALGQPERLKKKCDFRKPPACSSSRLPAGLARFGGLLPRSSSSWAGKQDWGGPWAQPLHVLSRHLSPQRQPGIPLGLSCPQNLHPGPGPPGGPLALQTPSCCLHARWKLEDAPPTSRALDRTRNNYARPALGRNTHCPSPQPPPVPQPQLRAPLQKLQLESLGRIPQAGGAGGSPGGVQWTGARLTGGPTPRLRSRVRTPALSVWCEPVSEPEREQSPRDVFRDAEPAANFGLDLWFLLQGPN